MMLSRLDWGFLHRVVGSSFKIKLRIEPWVRVSNQDFEPRLQMRGFTAACF